MGWEGGGGGMSDGVVKKVLLSYFYVAIWIFLSFTVIVYNKYILDPKMYNWPFPISLTMIHMSFCSAIAFLLVRVLRLILQHVYKHSHCSLTTPDVADCGHVDHYCKMGSSAARFLLAGDLDGLGGPFPPGGLGSPPFSLRRLR